MKANPPAFTLALWATASVAHAQLTPMNTEVASSHALIPMDKTSAIPLLRPMATQQASIMVSLTAMESSTILTSASLQPMLVNILPSPTNLTPMVAQQKVASVILHPMHKPPTRGVATLTPMVSRQKTTLVTLRPMQNPAAETAMVLTPMNGNGKPETTSTSSTRNISGPVEGLAALPPMFQGSARKGGIKGGINVAPGLSALGKPVVAAGTSPYQTTGEEVPTGNPYAALTTLTDAEMSPDPSIPTTNRPDDELVLVDVVINGIRRRLLMETYQGDDGVLWLPLTQLAQLLEMPLTVNAAAGVARGWYQSPTNPLMLSMKQNKLTIGAKSYPTSSRVEKHAADLYITSAAATEWFGLDIRLDYGELRIYIKTPNPLPGDVRAKRLETWDDAEKQRERNRIPSDTIVPGYEQFSLPVIRTTLGTNLSRSPNEDPAFSTGLTLQSENDMFGADTQVTLGFNLDSTDRTGKSSLTNGSILVQKRSKDGGLLGPLDAHYVAGGDIYTNPIPLSGISGQGRGFRVNNLPEGAVNDPDQYVLTGPAPVNWDAEVYQDQSLVAFARIGPTGTYRFNALPLKAGPNRFRIILYGPSGEREERQETIYLGDNIPARGTWQYDAALFQPNQYLIPGIGQQTSSTATTAQAQFTTGLTNNWAATVGAFTTTGNALNTTNLTPAAQGAGVGLRGSYGATYLNADLFGSNSGQTAQATLRTPLGNKADLRLSRMENFGFNPTERDELTNTTGEVNFNTKISSNTLNTTFGYGVKTYQLQEPQYTFSQRTSTGLGRVNATNRVEYVTQNGNTNINGTLEASTRLFSNSWRAGLTYQPTAPDLFQQFTLNTQVPVGSGKTLNLNYAQQLNASHNATLGGNMYIDMGPITLGLQSQAGSNGSMQFGVNAATAFVPQGNTASAGWKMEKPGSSFGTGQATIRVYADENANNHYDAGEPLIPNVMVFNRQRGSQQTTNTKGMVTFNNIAAGTLTRFDLDLTTLPDIYLKPVSDTLNVMAHIGNNGVLDYALRMYGEVSGQATTPTGTPLQNLKLIITDATGTKVDTAFTESDGFYTFGALPMGTYTITPEGGTPTTVTITTKKRIQTTNIISSKTKF